MSHRERINIEVQTAYLCGNDTITCVIFKDTDNDQNYTWKTQSPLAGGMQFGQRGTLTATVQRNVINSHLRKICKKDLTRVYRV